VKLGTTEHIKFKMLMRRLNLSQWQAVGVLESIWHLTARSCPAGDIGSFSNDEIAVAIGWDGDGNDLIDALVKHGWLDQSDEHRIIVHDWEEHCPTFIRGNMARHQKQFAKQVAVQVAKQNEQQVAKQVAMDAELQPALDVSTNPIQSNAIQSKSSAAHPSQVDPSASNSPPSPPEGEPPVGGEGTVGTDTTRTLLVMMLQEWNLNVAGAGFKQLRTIGGSRATAVRARLRESFWRENWQEGFEKLRTLPNLIGKCEFDWLVRPGNLEKLLEGQCDGWFQSTGPPASVPMRSRFETPAERMRRVGEQMLQEMDNGSGGETIDDQVIDVAGRVLQPGDDGGRDGGLLQLPF